MQALYQCYTKFLCSFILQRHIFLHLTAVEKFFLYIFRSWSHDTTCLYIKHGSEEEQNWLKRKKICGR